MPAFSSYDELPYDRLPLPETEPDFLAALARLHGFSAPDPAQARVLELGCAQGGNLIPMAARYPESEFLGVDLSRRQVEEGQAFLDEAGLNNIRLLQADIAALPDTLGEFDFILAHGVYSWVPATVREALLAACRRLLKPQGLAYVSFNVDPGWRLYGRLREALLAHDDAALSPPKRVARAKQTLETLSFDDERLNREVAYLRAASASYLFHEYLADINQPFSFGEFVGQAAAHGLRYLGEAGPRRARVVLENDWGLSAEARHERWLEAESRLDEALHTRFRRALLVRGDAPVPAPPSIHALPTLAFCADLTSDDELDFADCTTQYFVAETGERYPISQPLLKAVLVVLAGAYPDALSYAEALSRALPLAQEYGYAGEVDEACQEALLDAVQLHAVRPHTRAQHHGCEEAGLRGNRLARQQAATAGWAVTTCQHQALDLDAWGRWLLTIMDGQLSEAAIATRLASRLEAAGLPFEPQHPAQWVTHYLALFRHHGLLAT